jgi:DNA-binding transcriptional LysR family regulator
MNVSTRQLQAFIAIARLGSFTRAAEEVFMTQAGLSLMLKDLEAQVGARLFDRTTRSVRLTVAGETLLPTRVA